MNCSLQKNQFALSRAERGRGIPLKVGDEAHVHKSADQGTMMTRLPVRGYGESRVAQPCSVIDPNKDGRRLHFV